ncbi:two-component response regulator ORR5-like [Carex rostrata]
MADRITALLVECSVLVRCLYYQILTNLNFEVVSVQYAHEALELLQTDNDFDFIIIDAGRPDINGEVIMSLKDLAPHMKIIVSTFNIGLADGLLAAGADAFIIKPAQPEDIVDTLIELGIIG